MEPGYEAPPVETRPLPNGDTPSLAALGKHGLNSSAIEHAAHAVARAGQQTQRDALIDRLVVAKWVEQPAHRATTELILQLLDTGIAGDVALAARVAIHAGGAAYGKTVSVRDRFDAAYSAKTNSLNVTQQKALRNIKLLSKPPQEEEVEAADWGLGANCE